MQVADATVFAHLKQFDVSDDLSLQVKPQFNPNTRTPGLGLVLILKSRQKKYLQQNNVSMNIALVGYGKNG